MPYPPTQWNDNALPSLSASNFNKIEQGIKTATDETEQHAARTDNPHAVTARQVGALLSLLGIQNAGGDIALAAGVGSAIVISADGTAKRITIGENHSGRLDNPHQVTPAQIGAILKSGDANVVPFTLTRDPQAALEPATMQFVQAAQAGLDWKPSCRAATTAPLPAYAFANNVLTASANGVLPQVDGVPLAPNNRVLVKDETTANAPYNGIYTVTSLGSASAPWVLTRAADANANSEVNAGMFTVIEEGTTWQDTQFVLTTNDPITLNTTALVFSQYGNPGAIQAGAGLQRTGNVIAVIFGTGAGQVVQGNDTRLSDQRTPTPHNLFSDRHPDVNATAALTGGYVLTYNGTTGKWEPQAIPVQGGGVTAAALASTTSPTGSSLVGFAQTFNRAKGRTLQLKVAERISLDDSLASGSLQSTTGSITAGTTQLTVASAIDFAVGQGILVYGAGAPAVAESYTLSISAAAGTAGNVTLNLDTGNGVLTAFNVAVAAADTAATVASKIAAAVYTGWTTSYTAGTTSVTFTASSTGFRRDGNYSPGATGATGTLTLNTDGLPAQNLVSSITAISGTTVTLADNAGTTVSGATVVHDDTQAIQDVLDFAGAGGGEVLIPPKTYPIGRVTGGILLRPRSGVKLRGARGSSVLRVADNLTSSIRTIQPICQLTSDATTPNIRNASFEDFTIDMNGTHNFHNAVAGTYQIGLRCSSGSNLRVRGVEVRDNAGQQCYFFGTSSNPQTIEDLWIEDCRVRNTANAVNDGNFLNTAGTGTVSVNAQSAPGPSGGSTVTGVGTAFTTQLQRGRAIVINGFYGIVDSIQSDTSLTLYKNWTGPTVTGASYTLGALHSMQTDHSSFYIAARRATVTNNYLYNDNVMSRSTAMEIHSQQSTISDNYAYGYATGFNVVATVSDHTGTVYRGNKIYNCETGVRFWAYSGFTMRDVEFEGNVFELTSLIDNGFDFSGGYVQVPIDYIRLLYNTVEGIAGSVAGTGIGSGMALGRVKNLIARGNTFRNLAGRAISAPDTLSGDLAQWDILNNIIVDCCRTNNAGYKDAMNFNSSSGGTAQTLASLRIEDNRIYHTGAATMTGGINGSANVSWGLFADNDIQTGASGVATHITWASGASIGYLRVNHRGPGDPETVVRANPESTWIDSATAVYYIKKAGVTAATGWNREMRGTAPPASGTFRVGDIMWNTAPAASGYLGWICVAAGTPGTWKGFGAIAA